MTDPPIIGDLGVLVGKRVGAPVLVISQDVFPEIATELDRLRNPAVIGVLRGLVGAYLRRADRIVAIGETMRERLEAKGAPPERLRVIPNWVDTRAITPQPRDNEWAEQHGLVGSFVVMHSGNVGHAQDLDSLVRVGDVPPRPRGRPHRHRRLRRPPHARWSHWPSGSRSRRRCASSRTRSASACRSRSRARTSTSSGSRRGSPATSCRAGSTGSSPLAVRSRGGRRVERDCAARARGRLRHRHPTGRPDLLARTIREAADGAFDLDGDGPARPRVRRGGGRPGRRDGALSRPRPGDARGVIARAAFWGSLGALAWTHAGYPLAMGALARLRPRPVRKADETPSVALVVSAHNEEAVIRRRIENALALDYPEDRLEIVVASDGSTDLTDGIVGEIAAEQPACSPPAVPARRQGRRAAPLGSRDDERRARVHGREQRVEARRVAGAHAQPRRPRGRLRVRPAPAREPGRREHGGRSTGATRRGCASRSRRRARSPRGTARSTR